MNWFKLIGAVDREVSEDWARDEERNLAEIRFPWNKPPGMCTNDRIIVYTVGSQKLIATQSVAAPPSNNPRRGPPGSRDDRWPHSVEVTTHYFCSPLESAPSLREVAPEFAEEHAKRFRNGSHWRISDEEYEELAAAIEAAGRPHEAS